MPGLCLSSPLGEQTGRTMPRVGADEEFPRPSALRAVRAGSAGTRTSFVRGVAGRCARAAVALSEKAGVCGGQMANPSSGAPGAGGGGRRALPKSSCSRCTSPAPSLPQA